MKFTKQEYNKKSPLQAPRLITAEGFKRRVILPTLQKRAVKRAKAAA